MDPHATNTIAVGTSRRRLQELRERVSELEEKEKLAGELIQTVESHVIALAQASPGFQLEYVGA